MSEMSNTTAWDVEELLEEVDALRARVTAAEMLSEVCSLKTPERMRWLDEHMRKLEAAQNLTNQLVTAAKTLLCYLPECEIDLAHVVWGNTNTALVLEARRNLAALIDAQAEIGT